MISVTKARREELCTVHCHSDPTYFPFRKTEEERGVSLSGAGYMSGKEKLIIPPEIEKWVNSSEIHYDVQTLEHQQEFETAEMSSGDDKNH